MTRSSHPGFIEADSRLHRKHKLPIDPVVSDAADKNGFSTICRVRDHRYVVIECRTCNYRSVRRISVVKNDNPVCHNCIRQRRIEIAQSVGARLVCRDKTKGRHDYVYELKCGHFVSRQVANMERAAAGLFDIACDACRDDKYRRQAERLDWKLEGPALPPRPNYRRYRHSCGHEQNITVQNMYHGDCDCAGCGETWSSKPSYIYIFEIDLPHVRVVKFGYSSTPEIRLRQQLGISKSVARSVRRKIPVESGNIAVSQEKLCHNALARNCPEFIVPKSVFGDGINTKSEIYYRDALPVFDRLIEAIEAGYQPDDKLIVAILEDVRKLPWSPLGAKPDI